LSGVFLEQCEAFDKDVLESFKQLAKTGCVEFLNQTYYHSIASLYPEKDEFIEQIKLHKQAVEGLLGTELKVFENTELLYNNAVARVAEELGYKGIYTEGIERILKEKSPNFVYTPKGCSRIRLLLRNYKLTDDIGFRFSARWWSEWPLTAEKYACWLAMTGGQCISIFPDYETFGEHHWPETGIHEFLKHLPDKILEHENLRMATPSEVIDSHKPVGEVDVPETSGTISWADIQRDSSGWLGNAMQWAYYKTLLRLKPLVEEAEDKELLRLWRCFQTSDHLYYMFTAGGGPGEVHSYFSPYESPADAFVVAHSALLDFESRVRNAVLTANEPFLFYKGVGENSFTGIMAWSLKGFAKAVKRVDVTALDFHNTRGDFEMWAQNSLRDKLLAQKLAQARVKRLKGERLRSFLAEVTEKHLAEVTRRMVA
jgi:alpha-amylase